MELLYLLSNYLPGHRTTEWSWKDEEIDIGNRICICCGLQGHYQEQLEAYIGIYSLVGMGICLGTEGFIWDGHHRIIAAIHLNIPLVPIESRQDADTRWLRDHGTRSWEDRLFGDFVGK